MEPSSGGDTRPPRLLNPITFDSFLIGHLEL